MSPGRGYCWVGGREINWAPRRWVDKGISQATSFLQCQTQASGQAAHSVSSVCEMHFSDTYQAMWIRFQTAQNETSILWLVCAVHVKTWLMRTAHVKQWLMCRVHVKTVKS